MRKKIVVPISLTFAVLGMLIFVLPAGAGHEGPDFPEIDDYAEYLRSNPSAIPRGGSHRAALRTANMHGLGHSPHPATFLGEPDGVRHISSDIAFWGDLAFDGNYDGFRIIDISAPGNPKEIVHQGCNGDQGDIVVWENILVRAWNTKKATARDCDGETVPAGWEGVHVFDLRNLTDPDLVA